MYANYSDKMSILHHYILGFNYFSISRNVIFCYVKPFRNDYSSIKDKKPSAFLMSKIIYVFFFNFSGLSTQASGQIDYSYFPPDCEYHYTWDYIVYSELNGIANVVKSENSKL